ncbi:hypothetical protein PHMEG_00027627 [Phytophthora megakarya]|uniref:RNase H type-1 domain-containing protein n=1 Tax=Phytophthora megakarya TaxID=4795 RepID=A0A225V7X1_9STRA|nr:hypothetical protein PHMEG_00027627 [Phytophthora megakarya]
MAEYTGMNNGSKQPSISDSLITLLNRHRELTAKFKSVRYLHVIREYNAAADSLAGEALESKVSKVVLSDHRKLELKELNRIQEMIYDTSADNHRCLEIRSRTCNDSGCNEESDYQSKTSPL